MNDEKQIQSGILPHISIAPEHSNIFDRGAATRDNYNASLLFIDKHKFAFSIFTVIITLEWIAGILVYQVLQ